MTPKDLKFAIKALGWSQATFAARIKTHPNTVSKWATGQTEVPGAVAAYLELAMAVRALPV